MPLKKLTLKPGVNRENTRYTNENGWYESQWVRFRQGTPEKIGGFIGVGDIGGDVTTYRYPGVIRAINQNGRYASGAGSNGVYYQTPLGGTGALVRNGAVSSVTSSQESSAFTYEIQAVPGLITVLVPETGALAQYLRVKQAVAYNPTAPQAFVQFRNLNSGTYPWTWPDSVRIDPYTSYVYQVFGVATSGTPGYVAITVQALGTVTMGVTSTPSNSGVAAAVFQATDPATLPLFEPQNWSIANFGDTTLFNSREGVIWIWPDSNPSTPPYTLADLTPGIPTGATANPLISNVVLVSDVSRFVMAFGTTNNETPATTATFDPMLVRWADQETLTDWEPTATNQAGSLQLSRGSEIVAVQQARQEILVWTDQALYSMQYVGAPIVWSAQLVGENISIAGQDCVAYANGVAYWMGQGKFYKYSGTVQTMRCDLRKYIFDDLNVGYYQVVSAGTNEAFNEVWWRYVSNASTDPAIPDKYVVYNYAEDIWYYGSDNCSVMNDSRIFTSTYPVKAVPYYDPTAQPLGVPCDYYSALFRTEYENDAVYNGQFGIAGSVAIPASILSAEFDLDDGHQFMFVWRMLPDVTFAQSTDAAPAVQFALLPMKNSGSGVTNPASVGGDNEAAVLSIGLEPVYTIEEFTGQVFTRVRARQMMIQVSSSGLGVAWQLGSPRLDMRPDGRR